MEDFSNSRRNASPFLVIFKLNAPEPTGGVFPNSGASDLCSEASRENRVGKTADGLRQRVGWAEAVVRREVARQEQSVADLAPLMGRRNCIQYAEEPTASAIRDSGGSIRETSHVLPVGMGQV